MSKKCTHIGCHQCAWNEFNEECAPYWKIDIIVRNPENGRWKVRAYATEHLDYSAWRLQNNRERYLYAEEDLIGWAISALKKMALYQLEYDGEKSN